MATKNEEKEPPKRKPRKFRKVLTKAQLIRITREKLEDERDRTWELSTAMFEMLVGQLEWEKLKMAKLEELADLSINGAKMFDEKFAKEYEGVDE